MEINEYTTDNVAVLEPTGRIDSSTSKAFEDRILGLIDQGSRAVIVDFSKLDYISSAGLRVLLMAAKKVKAAQGSLALAAMSPPIMEVFQVSGFSAIFTITETRDEAVAKMGG